VLAISFGGDFAKGRCGGANFSQKTCRDSLVGGLAS
jgi:hypothetical protein